jgi:methylenetetrahydrofolate dehydrogenase (NADP+)/methenyltetrahydrofolate cyclohydrolase
MVPLREVDEMRVFIMAETMIGKPVADAISARLGRAVGELKSAGVTPALAVVRVGGRGSDIAYERGIVRRGDLLGVSVRKFTFGEDVRGDELLGAIDSISRDDSIHGALIFRPLPGGIDDAAVCGALSPPKDVDGITDESLAGLISGRGCGYAPCTAQACLEIFDHYDVGLCGKKVVIIGRSLVVGKPLALMLINRHATVTICHTRTVDLPSICGNADVLIAAVGRPNLIDRSYMSPGQIIVDVGINADSGGKLCGDVNFSDAEIYAGAITPVPGGVGAVTAAVLMKHVVEAAMRAS